MRFIPVEKLPEQALKRQYKRLDKYFKMFMQMNTKYARVDFDSSDYVTEDVGYQTIHRFATDNTYPIRVQRIGAEIYIIRTDMEG
jgi:hypothetical protein